MAEQTKEVFKSTNENYRIFEVEVQESCPSNIALVKYWGKYPDQIPANPSLSYTLNACRTQTQLHFKPDADFSVKTFLSGTLQPAFSEKIEKYFKNIEDYLPWILKGSYEIYTENSFPHSSGIASSASGFGALAKCLMQMDLKFLEKSETRETLQKASFLARLGSGSACRSLYPGMVVWGKTEILAGSSDLYGVPYPAEDIHPVFRNFNDWVLLIHEGEKAVSSTVGHALMNDHPYAEARFADARKNMKTLSGILKSGDLKEFIRLTEHEALSLHAMMMLSDPAYILMKAGTLQVIHEIWKFRKETGLPLFFTLDAGANVHLLFPENENSEEIRRYIEDNLLAFTQKGGVVKDRMHF